MPLIEELGRNLIHFSDDGSFVTSFIAERVTSINVVFCREIG